MSQHKEQRKDHYDNYMAISKVLSLLKNFEVKDAQDIVSANGARRVLKELQSYEYDKEMEEFRASMEEESSRKVSSPPNKDWRSRADIIGGSFGGTGAI